VKMVGRSAEGWIDTVTSVEHQAPGVIFHSPNMVLSRSSHR